MAAAARVRRSVFATLAVAALLAGGGGVGCVERESDTSHAPASAPQDPAAAPRYASERADVAVMMASAPSDLDWFNAAVQTFGSARLLPLDATAETLAQQRVVVVPAGAARDDRLFAACRSAADSGLVVLVDLSSPSDERAAQSWRDLAALAPERVIIVDSDRAVDARTVDLVAILEPAAPLPRLLSHPAGFAGFVLPVVAGESAALGALEPSLAPVIAGGGANASAAIAFSACVRDPSVNHRDLEALRRLGAEIGIELAASGAPPGSDGQTTARAEVSREAWTQFDATREAMRRMGASEAELGFAFAQFALGRNDYARLAEIGVKLFAFPRERAASRLPFELADERGAPLPLVVIPCTDVTHTVGDPDQLAAELADAARDSLWVTRVETYSRFWEARARSPLTSEWDGSRLRIDADALIDLLVVAIPRSAAGKSLSEILKDGASIPLGAGASPIEVPLARGKNTIWAIYK